MLSTARVGVVGVSLIAVLRSLSRRRARPIDICAHATSSGHRPNSRCYIRSRRELGHQPLNLTGTLVLRALENPAVVLVGQMLRQQMNRTKMEFTALDHLQDDRKPTGHSSRPKPFGRHLLRHRKPLHAEGEHGGTGMPGPDFPLVDLGDRDEQLGRRPVVADDKGPKVIEQLLLGKHCYEIGGCHEDACTTGFSGAVFGDERTVAKHRLSKPAARSDGRCERTPRKKRSAVRSFTAGDLTRRNIPSREIAIVQASITQVA
jgi:hypothetical protein